MAIGTSATIEFYGTQTDLTAGTTPGTIPADALSVAGDVDDWTNEDDAPMAMFVLTVKNVSAVATEGETIDLYCKQLNMVNTSGDHYGPVVGDVMTHYLGSFTFTDTDPGGANDNFTLGPVKLPNVQSQQEYEFYLLNNTSITIGDTTNEWELWITPVAYGPHA